MRTERADLLVVIPAFNEEESVGAVVRDARSTLTCDVVVVDDGSTDGTAVAAASAGAAVLRLPFNLGVGGALRTALRYAAQEGYRMVVQLDGDGQHDAAEAKRLVDELQSTDADLVVGSRFEAGYRVGRVRRLSMRILAAVVSRHLGTPITDTTSGMRAMSSRAIALFARRYPVDYLSDTVEALVIAGEEHLRVREIEVRMRPRQGGVASASSLRSAYHMVRLLLGVALRDARRRPSPEGAR